MQPIYIAICDDDPDIRSGLTKIIKAKWKEYHPVTCFSDGTDLVEHYREKRRPFHVILLDIYMKELSGIDTARLLREYDEQVLIILLTSSSDHMLDGYDINAYHYLVKPVQPIRLRSVLEKAFAKLAASDDSIVVKQGRDYKRLYASQIKYVSVDGNHLRFCLSSGEAVEIVGPMKEYVPLLSQYSFVQIQSGCLVNLEYVSMVDNASRTITLRDGEELPISRERVSHVSSEFFHYNRGTQL